MMIRVLSRRKERLFVETDNDLPNKFSSARMRAARALLRWIYQASKVGVATIRRVEFVDGEIAVTLANEAALRLAWESAGFFDPLS